MVGKATQSWTRLIRCESVQRAEGRRQSGVCDIPQGDVCAGFEAHSPFGVNATVKIVAEAVI